MLNIETINLKAILLDVDDTLFNLEGEYVEDLLVYLNLLQNKGIIISLLTARSKYFVNNIIQKLNLVDPVMLENGSVIYNPKTSKFEIFSEFDEAQVKYIYERISKYKDIRIGINTISGFYVNEKYYEDLIRYLNKEDLYKINSNPIVFKETLSIWMRDLTKVMLDNLIDDFKEYNNIFRIENNENLYSLFILGENAKKELGFTKWCTYCNIPIEEVLFIGDSDSDIEVSKLAGIGGAVGNASSDLKLSSDVVAKSNYGEGVLEILNLIFKNIK